MSSNQGRFAGRTRSTARHFLIWSYFAQVVLMLFALSGSAAEKPDPAKKNGAAAIRTRFGERQRVSDQRRNSLDAGDFHFRPAGKRFLHRLAGAVVVRVTDLSAKQAGLEQLTGKGGVLEGYAVDFEAGQGFIVLKAPDAERAAQRLDPLKLQQAVTAARRVPGVASANPLFIDPQSALWLIPTEDIIIRLRPGVDAKAYFAAQWAKVRPLGGTTDQFVLRSSETRAEGILAKVNELMGDARVVWAEPDFLGQQIKDTNDPLYPSEWHLNNTGQRGGKANADVNAPEAWSITSGSSNIVIALLDDGTQLAHPDLASRIFSNPGEIAANGLDDDNNGYTDDVHGWDFVANDNDPNPVSPDDNHGTATAGVAGAAGNNAIGVAGMAYGCKLMPLKVITGSTWISLSQFAEVIYYAAGRSKDGIHTWRGADLLSISLTFPSDLAIDDALHWAATSGRGGKGCAIFASAGNGAYGFYIYTFTIYTSGTHSFRWEYQKDGSDSAGEDAVWLDDVVFPGGAVERFEGTSFPPAGWTTGGNLPWVQFTGPGSDHCMGTGLKSARSGSIGDGQSTYLQTIRTVSPGNLTFFAWVSSESGYDYFNFYFDGTLYFNESGVPDITTPVSYPASHADTIAVGASTDFDFRSDYSQYGADLDFVAPSDGGVAGIYSTDRTGLDGETSGEYNPNFGGTSASAPLAAGTAALILSANPDLTAFEIRALMRNTADKIGSVAYDSSGFNQYYGYGRINAGRAVDQARPDLVLSMTHSPSPVVLGRDVTYSLALSNIRSGEARNVVLTNWLPANVTLISATNTVGSNFVRTGNLLSCNLGTLASGLIITSTIIVSVNSSQTLTNIALAASGALDANATNNSARDIALVLVPPLITNQPQSQVVVAGVSASLRVQAAGTSPLNYRWWFNQTTTSSNWTNAVLTLTNVQSTNMGNYQVVITNAVGAATSAVAMLTVLTRPGITNQPQSQTVIQGNTAQFRVGVAGTTPFYYRWRRNVTNIIANATNDTLILPAVQPTNAGAYTVVVTNLAGAATSSVATLTVTIPPSITVQPQSQTVGQGKTVTLSVTAAGTSPLGYQWQSNGTNLPGATAVSFTQTNFQRVHEAGYDVVITNVAGAKTSDLAVLYLNLPLRFTNWSILSNGSFHARLLGVAGSNYVIDASSNLSVWPHLKTNLATNGIIEFLDPGPTNSARRFYRSR